jgi:tetratricopeptide (TPR) repeat protein
MGPLPARVGDPRQQIRNPRGVVLSDGVYLGPREINSMRTIPELVFVNCCYLAARDVRQLFTSEQQEREPSYRGDRPAFASGVAEALIKLGVRCVIAAGWAVDDLQAMVFARTFYQQLMNGRRFIDAAASARHAAWRLGGNTWAAYQCYGDPDWVFRRGVGDAQRPTASVSDPYASIASARGLVLALQTIAVECEFQKKPKQAALERIRRLEEKFADRWGHHGRVAESFAIAHAKAGDERRAVEWYTKALRANDGGASLKSAEQRANLQVRLAWNAVNVALGEREASDGSKGTTDGNRLRRAIAQAKPEIAAAIALLEKVVAIEPSMERASLLGSAHKRLALIAASEGDAASEAAAIAAMKRHYEEAERFGRDNRVEGFFYPALNRLAAEFALGDGPVQLDPQATAAIRADLESSVRDKPDFWSVVSQTELQVYESLSRGDLAAQVDRIVAAYDDLHLRIQMEWMWRSVYDQAQFVLPKYAKGAPPPEQEAARRVIARLGELSGRPGPGEPPPARAAGSRSKGRGRPRSRR